MFLPELARGNLIPFFEGADQMAAVRKAGLSCNIVQIVVGKEQKVFDFIQTDKFNILLAALPVVFQKQFGEVRVAHVVFVCQRLNVDVLLRMPVNVDKDILHTLLFTLGDGFEIKADPLAVPCPQKAEEQCGKKRVDVGVVAVFLFAGFPLNGYKKIIESKSREIFLRK